MNVFDLYAKIALDTSEYESGLDGASGKTSSFADKLKTGLATAAKVGAAALTAASGAVATLAKASVEGYAEYEQLVGGVETLFGAANVSVEEFAKANNLSLEEAEKQLAHYGDQAQNVLKNAANAYKSAGMSSNEYMSTVTSFSASLISSLGEYSYQAAAYADTAITDMADNANKMGTSMEAIQNAYQGFAKQNYTMLDNLKLGYGGTKTEMERLLRDAEELEGLEVGSLDVSNFADIVDAIHIVQTEMGITGTTAKEASATIEGSVASMKGAWANLVTGIADENANLDELIGNLIDSVVTVGENIIPRVEQILSGIGTAVTKLAPVISEAVPELVTNVLPTLLDAGVQLIEGLLQGLITALPSLAESAVSIIEMLATSIIEQLPALMEAAVEVIITLANGIAESLPELIPTIVDVVLQIVETLIDNVDMLIDAAIAIIIALADGLINALPTLIEKVPEIIVKLIEAFVTNAPKLLTAALTLIVTLAKGLITSIPELIKAIPQIVTAIVKGFTSFMSQIKDIGKNIVKGVWEGIQAMASWITGKVKSFFSGIVSGVKGLLGINSPSKVFASIGGFMAEGLGEGWEDEYSSIKKQIEDGMNFGAATVDFESSGIGRYSGALQSMFTNLAASMSQNATIIVQSVLDGKVIGETAYQYSKNRQRAYGVT